MLSSASLFTSSSLGFDPTAVPPSLFERIFGLEATSESGITRYIDAVVLDMYEATLKDGYVSNKIGTARIRQVQFMKNVSSPEHEYLLLAVASAEDWDNDIPLGIIRCERTVDPEDETYKRQSGAFLHKSSPSSESMSDSVRPVGARDRFVVCPSYTGSSSASAKVNVKRLFGLAKKMNRRDPLGLGYGASSFAKAVLRSGISSSITLYTYDFPCASNAPSFPQFLAALQAIHNYSPNYLLLSRQCYWFAGMLFRALVGEAVQNLQAQTDATVKHAADADKRVSTKNAGTFKRFFKLVTGADVDAEFKRHIQGPFETSAMRLEQQIEAAKEERLAPLLKLRQLQEEIAALKGQRQEKEEIVALQGAPQEEEKEALLTLPLVDVYRHPVADLRPPHSGLRTQIPSIDILCPPDPSHRDL
ncbi:hypothetical protein BD414DRAFT_539197 [Trametes punicea]|nr:hypothetical protein BD414DRAFT_539197 [Trametes punicea]